MVLEYGEPLDIVEVLYRSRIRTGPVPVDAKLEESALRGQVPKLD